MFDDKLSWKPHIQLVCSKLSRGSWARNYVNTKTLKIVYYSLVYKFTSTILHHFLGTSSLASKCIPDPLVKLQKRIEQIISKSLFLAHTQPLFHDLKLLKIKDIRKLEITKSMHRYTAQNKVKNNATTSNLKLAKHVHHYNTRYSLKNNYFLICKWTENGKKFFGG